jgi:hypothetical protein
MAKDESVNVNAGGGDADVNYIELVGIVNSLTTKLAEMGTAQENMTAKVMEMGTVQENLAAKTFVAEEKGYDIGTSEAYQMNMKRLVDEYMDASLEASRRQKTFGDQIVQAGIDTAKFMKTSVVTTMDMIAKQAIAHRDLAIDSEWKPKPKTKDPLEKEK